MHEHRLARAISDSGPRRFREFHTPVAEPKAGPTRAPSSLKIAPGPPWECTDAARVPAKFVFVGRNK